ncbi:MAG: MaoC family dehydratase N-terminal domain-containing protein [Nocardioides sp.]
MDDSIIGRTYPPTPPYEVTRESVAGFAASLGQDYDGGPAPLTFPIVPAFTAMMGFLAAEKIDLARVVHGEQNFSYQRPVVAGDRLSVSLTVETLRQIGGNDIVGTTSAVTDASGSLVCTATATLVHRGAAGEKK